MTILNDKELLKRIEPSNGNPPIVEGIKTPTDWFSESSPIQPSSIDLHIRGIFVPGTPIERRGSEKFPYEKYSLEPGKTVMVDTSETLHMPSDLAGIGLPQSRMAVKGILMTNPGHIDPGYTGQLSFTLINMSNENYILHKGDSIFTILFLTLSSSCQQDLNIRKGGATSNGGVRQDNLNLLSKEFMNVEQRAKDTIRREGIVIGICISAIASLIAIGMQYLIDINGSIDSRISANESTIRTTDISNEINLIKGSMTQLEESISRIESTLATPQPDN